MVIIIAIQIGFGTAKRVEMTPLVNHKMSI
jgi:hypothetical protein